MGQEGEGNTDDVRLLQAVHCLPPRALMALMLSQEGYSYEQMAPVLHVSSDQARTLLERAMEYLIEIST